MNRGYIKIWRKLEDSGLLQVPNTLAVFMYILLNATHKDIKKGTASGVITLQRGQLISGRIKLAEILEQSEQQIRTSLDRLVSLKIITITATNRFSVYTIVNYNNYQDVPESSNQHSNQQITNSQPTVNQQSTTEQALKHLSIKELKQNPSLSEMEFERFWKRYPKKTGKATALAAWKKTRPALLDVLKTLEWQVNSDQWLKDGGQYIPNPATYLNQGRWHDEPTNVKRNLSTIEQIFGGRNGNDNQIIDITETESIESDRKGFSKTILGLR